MDYSKARCPICLNRFCCAEHKDEHIKNNHPEFLKSYSQDYLLKKFQRKAEHIMTNAQKYRAQIRRIEQLTTQNAVNIKYHEHRLLKKRPHSEMNQEIISTSIIIKSESRKILVPAHRSKGKIFSTNEMGPKGQRYFEIKKNSPCDVTTVKTSTPIIDNNLVESTPQNTWNISQTSSISSYHTPSAFGAYRKTTTSIYETPSNSETHPFKSEQLELVNSQLRWVKRTITSPRSIMSKISKYDNETGPSPNPNSKCRRVTFSFSSANSSPLESVQEVEICKDIIYSGTLKTDEEKENDIKMKKNICNQPSDVKNNLGAESTSSDTAKNGFFNCVTSMICSAVPIFASWRESQTQTDQVKGAKRLRSPDTECVGGEVEASQSPQPKRLCYPFDLRLNPIKARKPISGK